MNKHLLFSLIFSSFCLAECFAQNAPPQLFQYQAVARDGMGLLINQPIDFQIEIRQGGMNGNIVYSEDHSGVMTNEFGLFTLQIGGRMATSGNAFTSIDWPANTHWLRIGFRPPGQSDLLMLSATQLLSVPYALYAEKAGNTNDLDADPTNEIQTLSQNGLIVSLSQSTSTISVADNDNDSGNELIQNLQLNGTTLQINEAGNIQTVNLSALQDGVNDADADPTNELQTLSLSGTDLTISNSNEIVSLADISTQWINNPTGIHYGNLNGRVGIGTDNPAAGLEVVQNSDAPAFVVTQTGGNQPVAIFKRDPAPGSEAMIITRPGSVGIGIADPQERLHLYNGLLRIDRPDLSAEAGTYIRFFKTGSEYSRIGLNENNGFCIFRGATDQPALNVQSNGNVGIGTTNPDANLQINGTVRMLDNWDARTAATTYQAPTDGFVVVRLTVTGANKIRAEGYTSPDDDFVEAEIRAGATAWSNADVNSFTMPVAKGEYWKVEITAQDPSGTNIWVQWRPLGLGN